MTTKIKITGCRDPRRWYAGLIGQTVPYLNEASNGEWKSRQPGGPVNFVQYYDGELIEEENVNMKVESIRDRFTPETHKTRCGAEWRWLDVKGKHLIAVEVLETVENIFAVNIDGVTTLLLGMYIQDTDLSSYNLTPIQHPPVELPTNLQPEICYAAMYKNGKWVVAETLLFKDDNCWGGERMTPLSLAALILPKDPAGWENSLHKLVDGVWERVNNGVC